MTCGRKKSREKKTLPGLGEFDLDSPWVDVSREVRGILPNPVAISQALWIEAFATVFESELRTEGAARDPTYDDPGRDQRLLNLFLSTRRVIWLAHPGGPPTERGRLRFPYLVDCGPWLVKGIRVDLVWGPTTAGWTAIALVLAGEQAEPWPWGGEIRPPEPEPEEEGPRFLDPSEWR